MIAIHNSKTGFHPKWAAYCEKKGITYKLVDCRSNDIIKQLDGCYALMWHHSHIKSEDIIIAKQLLFALEHSGFVTFPNFKTAWHFDDKVGQKFLFEQLHAPLVPSYVFLDRKVALQWADSATYPLVFKLRSGAGSSNVRLVKTKLDAKKLINRAFGKGFDVYNAFGSIKERYRNWMNGSAQFLDVLKGLGRLTMKPPFSLVKGKEVGYIYFQEFLPDNAFDIRIVVIDQKAFGIKRMVRQHDFRASGSGDTHYNQNEIDLRCVKIALDLTDKIESSSAAFDFVFDNDGKPWIVEVSYGFIYEVYTQCPGYWDSNLNWHEGHFDPCGWMVDSVIKKIQLC